MTLNKVVLVPVEKLVENAKFPLADEGVCQRILSTFSTGTNTTLLSVIPTNVGIQNRV